MSHSSRMLQLAGLRESVEEINPMDVSHSLDSKAPELFYLARVDDETGISGTGTVCVGAIFQSGKVVAQWRPKREGKQSTTVYADVEEFDTLHVHIHAGKTFRKALDGSVSMRSFYVLRENDTTGKSRTGRVLEGVEFPSGNVVIEWRPPMSTVAIYPDFAGLEEIQLSHPSDNKVVWNEQ